MCSRDMCVQSDTYIYVYINIKVCMHLCTKEEERYSFVCIRERLHFFLSKMHFIHMQARRNKVSFPNPAVLLLVFSPHV